MGQQLTAAAEARLDLPAEIYLKKFTRQRRFVSGLTASPSSEPASADSRAIGPDTVCDLAEEESAEDAEGVLDLQLLLPPPPRHSRSLGRSLAVLSGDSSLRSREYCLFVSRVSLSDERRLCEGRVGKTTSGPEPTPPPALLHPVAEPGANPFSSKVVSRMRLESSVTGVLLCERSWSASATLGCSAWLTWAPEPKQNR